MRSTATLSALPAFTLMTCLLMPAMAGAADTEQSPSGWVQDRENREDIDIALSESIISSLPLDIPASTMVLDNGLTLVVHEDHSQPLVAVDIWYHVGSKDEPPGKTGFAHLFEHLMFNGSANFNDDFFNATRTIGATEQNGTTSQDRTDYFQTVPKNALDSILWLESDRMGHLLGAVDQAKLDEQLAVVKNEMRQLRNQPYAKAYELILRGTVPYGHPYSHPVIGSIADLDAASLEDVQNWFRDYYGPSNAVIVLAGDITPEEAQKSVEKYFGNIPAGRPVTRPTSWPVGMTEPVREIAEDRVSHPRLYRVWNTPEFSNPDTTYLRMLASILGTNANSRLYQRLVVDEELATGVSADVDTRELGGQFEINVTAKQGADTDRIEQIINDELMMLAAFGPTDEEIAYTRSSNLAGFARNLESISIKANILAESTTFLGDPDAWQESLDRYKTAQSSDLRQAAKNWLTAPDYVLWIVPFGDHAVSGQEANRSEMPLPDRNVTARFPDVETATLDNGMELFVAHHEGAPVVNFQMVMETGIEKSWKQVSGDTGGLAMKLLDNGTKSMTRKEINEQLGLLGATVYSGGGEAHSSVSLSALTSGLEESLSIYADIIMHPSFPEDELNRIKSLWLDGLAQDREDPGQMASRILPFVVLGPDNPYGRLSLEQSINDVDRSSVEEFHAKWFHPNNAKMIITGETTLAEVRPLVEAAFKGWDEQKLPETFVPNETAPQSANVYLMDKPGSEQSVIKVAVTTPPFSVDEEPSRMVFNNALGGAFVSRINMKLREEKGWSYGSHSNYGGSEGARMLAVTAPVQTDKTAEAMSELAIIFKDVVSDRAIDAEEVEKAKNELLLALPSKWSTGSGIASYILSQIVNDVPSDYMADYPQKLEAINLESVNVAAQEMLGGKPLTWVVVGDRSKIEDSIKALDLGTLHIIDADGNPVP